jgi:hypothetical protein
VPDTATTQGPAAPNGGAIVHFLSAVHQALDLPAPRRASDRLPYLRLLDQRAHLARASIGRLISNPHSDALDYISEGDHILHKVADLPPDTYRSRPAELLPPRPRSRGSRSGPCPDGTGQPASAQPAAGPSPATTGNGPRSAPAGSCRRIPGSVILPSAASSATFDKVTLSTWPPSNGSMMRGGACRGGRDAQVRLADSINTFAEPSSL